MSASEQALSRSPRVFISYSHDNVAHCDRVLALAPQLRRDGIETELDQFHQEELLHWPRWCEEQLRPEKSDFVLCVCTEEYKRRIENRVPAEVGKGVFWEGALIYDYLYDEKGNRRCIPLSLDRSAQGIPSVLNGYIRFELDTFSLENLQSPYAKLYRLLTRQPANVAAQVGTLQKLPSLPEEERRTDFIQLSQQVLAGAHLRFVKNFAGLPFFFMEERAACCGR
jgi:SEFIR domain